MWFLFDFTSRKMWQSYISMALLAVVQFKAHFYKFTNYDIALKTCNVYITYPCIVSDIVVSTVFINKF